MPQTMKECIRLSIQENRQRRSGWQAALAALMAEVRKQVQSGRMPQRVVGFLEELGKDLRDATCSASGGPSATGPRIDPGRARAVADQQLRAMGQRP